MANEGIELSIYKFNDPTQKLDTLEGRQSPTYLGELGVGGGSFKINKNDPKIVADPTLLKTRNVVKCSVDGKVVGAWLLQSRKATIVADGEKSAEGYELSGEGLLTWLNDAQVKPYNGLKTTSTDKRAFGFSAPKGDWYIDSDWVLPRGMVRWNTIPGNPWKYLPTNWPQDLFPNARWVWSDTSALHSAPAGNAYFRYDHGFPTSQQSCSLYVAASGAYTVYLDGEQIAQSDPVTGYTTKTSYEAKKIDFTVDAGEHVIGIVVQNPTAGPAGLLAGIVYYSSESPDINLGPVTIDIGTNAYVHRTAHGLSNDDAIYFTSTGKLPGGLTTNKTYYVANKSSDKFNVQATKTGVYIDTSGAQDGVHTLFHAGAKATPRLITFTGMTQTFAKDNYNNAKIKENKARNHYKALPAGSTASNATKTQKSQATKKAAALITWNNAKAVTAQYKHELDVAFVNAPWKANFYPETVPGPSAGEILQNLLDEAEGRGVLFPTWVHPTFTSFQDSNGSYWGDALDWEFDIGTSLADVVSKFADQGIDVWIDPNNYNLNAVINRGYDRTTYHHQSTFASSTATGPITLNAQLPQRMQDMVRSPNTGEFYISQTDDNDNVVITRNSATGTQLDYMTINGAGHGTSIALEYTGGKIYIWLANTGTNQHWRFPYHTGTYSSTTRPAGITYLPMFGRKFVAAQHDWLHDRMALRYTGTNGDTYELRKISEYIAGVDKIYGRLAMAKDAVMQGFFTYSNTFYYWTGSANSGTDLPRLVGYDWSTGQVVATWDGTGLTIGAEGSWWEPEGASLYDVDGSNPVAYIGMTYNTYAAGHTYKVYTLKLRNSTPVVTSTPVIFERGKNLTGADTQNSGKIKNSLTLKTSNGWYPTPAEDPISIELYGVIEDTLSTSSTLAATQNLAQLVMRDKSTEEDSATYTFTPTDKIPWVDFNEGDWVIAPDELLNQIERRIMSISFSETTNGLAQYAIEFDNIFQDNEARLNRIIQNLGGSGAGSGSASVTATAGAPTRLNPPAPGSALVPLPPENVGVTTVSGWDPQGQKAITQVVIQWDQVSLSEDGTDMTPTGYEVWGRPIDEDDNTVVWDPTDDPTEDDPDPNITADVTDDSDGDIDPHPIVVLDPDVDTAQNPWQRLAVVTATVATVGRFDPSSTWEFGVKSLNDVLESDWSQIVAIAMDVPAEPMDSPTAPTVTSALGVMKIHWDGLLVPAGGGTEPPPPRFKNIYAGISLVAGGPYTAMGSTATLISREIMITGLEVGTEYFTVLFAEDGLGVISAASGETSHTLLGVDLGDLADDLAQNLTDIQNLAQSAQDAANQAETDAANAVTSANGKNRVIYSTSAATGTTYTSGDTWYQYSGTNVIGFWSFIGGAWVAQSLSNAVISTLDAGKITTGFLSASRLQAGTITANKLAIADFTNLFENPTLDPSVDDPTVPRGLTGIGNPHGYTGSNFYLGASSTFNNDVYAPGLIPVVPGDQFFIQADMWFALAVGTGGGRVGFRFWQADKTTSITWIAGAGSPIPTAAGALTQATYSGSVTVPAGAAYAQFWFSFSNNGETTNKLYFKNLLVRRKATGSLIVDGTITATKIATGTITATQIQGGTITTNEIASGTITANNIAAGVINASLLDLGTVVQNSPTQRVPMPFAQQSYWSLILAGAATSASVSTPIGGAGWCTATATGILLSPTSTAQGFAYIMPRTAVPQSGKLQLSGVSTGAGALFQVKYFTSSADTTGTISGTSLPVSASGVSFTFPSNAVAYQVKVSVNPGGAAQTILSAQVFEIIGGGGTGQAAELSPSGMRLYDNNGKLAMDLTTGSQNFFNIYDNTQGDPITLASISQTGDAQFQEVSGTGFDLTGANFTITDPTDPLYPYTLDQSNPNGSGWQRGDYSDSNGSPAVVALLDRLGRGPIYDATWGTQNGNHLTTQYERIAQDKFMLEDGRAYEFVFQLAGLQTDLTSAGVSTGVAAGVNCYLEFQINLVPNSSITAGDTISRAVVYNNMRGYWALPPVVWTASSKVTAIDHINRILPANVYIYWQLNYNMSVAPAGTLTIAEFGGSRGLTVVDIGSAYVTRPNNGADNLATTDDQTSTGASSGNTSGGTTATSTTKTWTAAWSRSWNNSGSSIVSGTGQYTNGAAMYQGNGASAMGSKFGFAALGISGKTITACQIYIHNTYFAYPGKSALLGTHGDSSAPSTYTGARANGWNVGWSQGEGKWITVPKSLWASIASGTIRGFSLGVDGSDSNYAYFSGATQSNPPKLKITYH